MTRTSGIHGVGTAGFEHVDGQKTKRTLRVTIAKQRVWNIGPILQGLARPVLSRLVAAISGLGNTLDDVDRSANGMPMKRRRTPGWIGYFHDDKFPMISRHGKTFENLARDAGKPGLLGAGLLGALAADRWFNHGIPSPSPAR
jgi:hypothetical protein